MPPLGGRCFQWDRLTRSPQLRVYAADWTDAGIDRSFWYGVNGCQRDRGDTGGRGAGAGSFARRREQDERSRLLAPSALWFPASPTLPRSSPTLLPTIDDEAEQQERSRIDYHTLQSSLDPDELSRLEIEPDHAAIIFKRPKSFCAGDNFLLKLTSTGVFLYENYLLIVMADDSPIFEGRFPFPVKSIRDVILRLRRFYPSL